MRDPVVVDSVTQLDDQHRGATAIVGSHGGSYTASVAMTIGLRGLVCNDASVGRDGAGIRVLGLLDDIGLAAATIDHRTGKIGEGSDCSRHGIVSYVNSSAQLFGCAVGHRASLAARSMFAAEPSIPHEALLKETRFPLGLEGAAVPVWGIDSASLAQESDRGAILVTGSHGALLGNRPESALKADAKAAIFNDAGGGPDGRGRSRLPILDERGIAAVTVSAASAMIGSARSAYDDGLISYTNRLAEGLGARPGMTVPEFVELASQA